jgi:two-component sensor histidine kinase
MDGTRIMSDMRLGSHYSGTTKSYPADAGTTLWSRFEVLAAWSEQLPCGPGDVFGALLAATHPQTAKPGWTSLSLWNDEALHRAYCMLQLILRLRSMRSRVHWHNEFELASQLAVDFRSLFAAHENELVQCSEVLRDVVRNLGSLFGPAGGDIDIKTNVERLSLAAFGRRALVLVATELLLNVLGHAFHGRANGHVEVCLQRTSEGRARWRVTDDGIGHFETAEDADVSIAGRLAHLLGGRLVYRQDQGSATTAEIVFPVQAPLQLAGCEFHAPQKCLRLIKVYAINFIP